MATAKFTQQQMVARMVRARAAQEHCSPPAPDNEFLTARCANTTLANAADGGGYYCMVCHRKLTGAAEAEVRAWWRSEVATACG